MLLRGRSDGSPGAEKSQNPTKFTVTSSMNPATRVAEKRNQLLYQRDPTNEIRSKILISNQQYDN